MHFAGQVAIDASRDRVWAFLIDPNEVGSCGPGVESVDVVDPTHFRARAKVGVGFISARFVVDLQIAEQDPPTRAVIKAHGQAPGSAVDATAAMTLSDGDDGATVMDWTADVTIAGTLAARDPGRGDGRDLRAAPRQPGDSLSSSSSPFGPRRGPSVVR